MNRDDVIEYIKTSSPSDLMQILDAVVDAVSSVTGCATGCENDRHDLLLQIQSEEK